jgi:protein gp37
VTSFYHWFDTLHLNWQTGCEKGLPCWGHCWARAMANRLKGRAGYPADEPFRPTFHDDRLHGKIGCNQVVALNFMGDWALAKLDHLGAMVSRIADCRCLNSIFLTLTKRPEMLRQKLRQAWGRGLPDNLWLGMSTFGKVDRAAWDALNRIPAAYYWLSYEPLLEPPELPLPLPGWAVVGAESGRGARWGELIPRIHRANDKDCKWTVEDWTRSLVAQCWADGVPVMVKQLPVYKEGKWRVSSDPKDFPADLRVQERAVEKGCGS